MGYQTKLQEGRGGGAVSTNFPKMNAPPPVYFKPERNSLPPAPVSLSTCFTLRRPVQHYAQVSAETGTLKMLKVNYEI